MSANNKRSRRLRPREEPRACWPRKSDGHPAFSLHLVRSTLAIENMPRFAGAFALAPLRLFAAADIGANLVAPDNLLFGCNDGFFLIFRHGQISLVSVRGDWGVDVS